MAEAKLITVVVQKRVIIFNSLLIVAALLSEVMFQMPSFLITRLCTCSAIILPNYFCWPNAARKNKDNNISLYYLISVYINMLTMPTPPPFGTPISRPIMRIAYYVVLPHQKTNIRKTNTPIATQSKHHCTSERIPGAHTLPITRKCPIVRFVHHHAGNNNANTNHQQQ